MRKKIVNPKKLLLLDFIIIYSWCNFFEKVYILAKMSQKRTILAKLTILATPMCVTSHNTKNAWGTGWLSKKNPIFGVQNFLKLPKIAILASPMSCMTHQTTIKLQLKFNGKVKKITNFWFQKWPKIAILAAPVRDT